MGFGTYLKLAQSALKTEQGRQVGRKATDGLAAVGNRLTHDRYADTIEKARTGIHKQLGGDPGTAGSGANPKR